MTAPTALPVKLIAVPATDTAVLVTAPATDTAAPAVEATVEQPFKQNTATIVSKIRALGMTWARQFKTAFILKHIDGSCSSSRLELPAQGLRLT
jgi:hypothetical protein